VSAAIAAATGFSTGATAGATTATVTKPASSAAGDVLVIWVIGQAASISWSTPNFTALTAATGTNGSSQVLYRVLDGSGSDPGATFTLTSSPGGQWAGTCMRVTGANTSAPFDPAPTSGQVNTSSVNITAASITTTVSGDLLIWCGSTRATPTPGAITLPTGYTDSGAGQTASSAAASANVLNAAGSVTQSTAGATGNVIGTEASATVNCGVLLGMQAAAAAAPASLLAIF